MDPQIIQFDSKFSFQKPFCLALDSAQAKTNHHNKRQMADYYAAPSEEDYDRLNRQVVWNFLSLFSMAVANAVE